jgi:hypothetical protein
LEGDLIALLTGIFNNVTTNRTSELKKFSFRIVDKEQIQLILVNNREFKILARMKIPKTPQAKKRLSLLKDCQYTYGENNKSSRTSIRWRKRWVNSTYRHSVNQSLGEATADLDRLTDRAKTIERHSWKKCADMPLGEKLLRAKRWEIAKLLLSEAVSTDLDFFDKLARYLGDRIPTSGRITIIIRRVRAVMLDRHSPPLDLTWEDLTLLKDFLQPKPLT